MTVCQVDVQLLELGSVTGLELRPGDLADAGQQAVLQGEWRCLDEEVTGDLVRLQPDILCNVLQRLADNGL